MRRMIAMTFLANIFLGQLSTVPVAYAAPTNDDFTAAAADDSTACDEDVGHMSRIAHPERKPCPTDYCLDVSDPVQPDDCALAGTQCQTEHACPQPAVLSPGSALELPASSSEDHPNTLATIIASIVMRT